MTTSYPHITNADEYKKFISSSAPLITFGAASGTFVSFQPGDTANQLIRFRSGAVIDAIQIGNNKPYGGSGGNLSEPYQWPANGCFTLQSLWAGVGDNEHISNMTFTLGSNSSVTIGSGSYQNIALNLPQIVVTLAGILYGDYINQLSFRVVS